MTLSKVIEELGTLYLKVGDVDCAVKGSDPEKVVWLIDDVTQEWLEDHLTSIVVLHAPAAGARRINPGSL